MPAPDDHHRTLEHLYHAARCNDHFRPKLTVGDRRAFVELPLGPHLHHAANAVHGSNYFKVLDDAAYFAANSIVPDVFVLTASFHLDLLRPVVDGVLRAEGRVVHESRSRILADAVATDDNGRVVARGGGAFVPSAHPLQAQPDRPLK